MTLGTIRPFGRLASFKPWGIYLFFSTVPISFSDRLLVFSAQLVPHLIEADIGPRVWSDHAGLECLFQLQGVEKSRPRWRLNVNLLHLEPLSSHLERDIVPYFELNSDCGVAFHLVWDAMKAMVRGRAIAITTAYKRKKQKL